MQHRQPWVICPMWSKGSPGGTIQELQSQQGKTTADEKISCNSHGHPNKMERQRIAGWWCQCHGPDEGQISIVLQGDKKGLGRMAVVVLGVKQSMVQIGYCDMETGAQTECYKTPSSLIYLKGGLEMVINHAKRRVWIQQQRLWRRDPIEDQEQNN
jgi:hypothetical protein